MFLVVGGGFLGSYVIKELHRRSGEKIVYTCRTSLNAPLFPYADGFLCDVSSEEDLSSLKNVCGDESLTVIYLAACHNVDFLYEHPEEGKRVNIDALARFLALFGSQIGRLLFASTDCVYGEQTSSKPFCESDPLEPVCEYGRQKIQAEKLVNAAGGTAARFPFMLGPSLGEKKHFYDNIISKLKSGESVEMIDGMYRSVLSYADAARLTVSLALYDGALPSAVNVCGDRGYGKYDVGRVLAENTGVSSELVIPLTPEQGRKFFKDARANKTLMDNSLLKSILGLSQIIWEEDR